MSELPTLPLPGAEAGARTQLTHRQILWVFVGLMLGMFLAGRLIGRIDYRIVLATGLVLMGAGLALLSRIETGHAAALGIVSSLPNAV